MPDEVTDENLTEVSLVGMVKHLHLWDVIDSWRQDPSNSP